MVSIREAHVQLKTRSISNKIMTQELARTRTQMNAIERGVTFPFIRKISQGGLRTGAAAFPAFRCFFEGGSFSSLSFTDEGPVKTDL